MIFEQQFPSLKGKDEGLSQKELLDALDFELNHHNGELSSPDGKWLIRKSDIQKHCIDKQKVIDVIVESLKEGFSEEWLAINLETTDEAQLLASMIMDKLGLHSVMQGSENVKN